MTDDPNEIVLIDTVIAAPYDTVWNALRDPAEIRRWHGWDYDGLDDEIDVIYLQDAEPSAEQGTIDFTGDTARFTLAPFTGHGDQTRLTVTKPGPAGDASWEDIYDDIEQGWITFVHQLKFALERHPGADRRTVLIEAGRLLTAASLGFTTTAPAAPGQRYASTTAWGQELSGELLFQTRHQIGLTVDSYGDGLVVFHTIPAAARPPDGAMMAVITTYGLSDAELDDIEALWATAARAAAASE